ncbi:MAG: glycosyltransferase family 2 protein [Microcystis novacekii Mn_MB_F_20050700_S1]|uniref:Glycosyltransferase family 2 protein n=1 Tax=Microcystis novacekii Mn_MB_F_20050700_S1D TaxID=2486266 RepID=A0A552J6U0_9CHRO|nr:MAG: glycosyltransferase family 2 protein [Microcystis novacekii Mn_MB_F_20050700_S1]TRU91476.1 MAG: glycosyltransferase family 2 protein [Microcystis novacekii Mn_MB_F_20050700_S1D]
MTDFQLTTPVAFLIFNRPDTTARVFEAIRQAKPPKLLVVADGPRPDRPDDVEKCKAARAIIDRVDWDCEVLTNYSDVNLGCGKRPATGITWVFEQVEEAIIFEDDCLPHPTFFRFCEELLNYYRHDERIMVISGNNFQFGRNRTNDSYYFSRYNHIWGWASWRRAWKYFDYDLKLWPKIKTENLITSILEDRKSVKYWTKNFQRTYEGNPTVWDYRWTFACWIQNGLTILPNVNLVSNIGFGEGATHTSSSKSKVANLPVEEMIFPLKHPPFLLRHVEADDFTDHNIFYVSLLSSLSRKLAKVFIN